jgi:hypothetical protein
MKERKMTEEEITNEKAETQEELHQKLNENWLKSPFPIGPGWRCAPPSDDIARALWTLMVSELESGKQNRTTVSRVFLPERQLFKFNIRLPLNELATDDSELGGSLLYRILEHQCTPMQGQMVGVGGLYTSINPNDNVWQFICNTKTTSVRIEKSFITRVNPDSQIQITYKDSYATDLAMLLTDLLNPMAWFKICGDKIVATVERTEKEGDLWVEFTFVLELITRHINGLETNDALLAKFNEAYDAK